MTTSRERVLTTLNHQEPDCVPLDLGGTAVSGMAVSSVYKLRQALRLDPPGTPVKVVEPFQMLGEITPDLQEALGVDVVGIGSPRGFFGFENRDWQPWTTFDGTPVLVPGAFNTEPDENGDILMYPEGDLSAPPSGRMPAGGWYFDAIIRQDPIDDEKLNVEDNLEEFGPISDADLAYIVATAEAAYASGRAVMGSFGGTAFGDIAMVPATQLRHPRGIRDVAEWYMSTVSRRDYIYKIFERQCEIGIANLERIHAAVGDMVIGAFITGTDFGAQNACFISPRAYRNLYMPFHKAVNDWVHTHTNWKSFIHSCGSIMQLLPDIVAAGFDILNPVQTSAANMDPVELKARFGDKVTFWGGGVDTQQTLPFGTPDEVYNQVRDRIRIFGEGGGFVFNTIHNVQASIPAENLLAMYNAVRDFRAYPL